MGAPIPLSPYNHTSDLRTDIQNASLALLYSPTFLVKTILIIILYQYPNDWPSIPQFI